MKFYYSRILSFLLAVFTISLLSQSIYAKCDYRSVAEEFEVVDEVLVGKVINVERLILTYTVPRTKSTFTFEVIESLKGIQKETVDVITLGGTSESDYPFKKDEKYLVYAYRQSFSKNGESDIEIITDRCTRTRNFEDAAYDITSIRAILSSN